jgi:hypothetical protein
MERVSEVSFRPPPPADLQHGDLTRSRGFTRAPLRGTRDHPGMSGVASCGGNASHSGRIGQNIRGPSYFAENPEKQGGFL